MPVTIKDISRHVGLSVSTVSKALNNYPDISAESRERVLAASQALGYHPHAAARNLRRQRTDKIGIAYPLKGFESEILVGFFRGLTHAAQQRGYTLVLYTISATDIDTLKAACGSREVDGMILMGASLAGVLDDAVTLLKEEGLPFVVLGHPVAGAEATVVATDNTNGIEALMAHLLELGHTRIAYIARPDDAQNNQERFHAYRTALQRAQLPFNPDYIAEAPYLPYSGMSAMRTLLALAEPPTAVVAYNDHIAIDACRAALELNLKVPQDVAVAGYGNIPSSLIVSPAITTLAMPLREMGEAALDSLVMMIETGQAPPSRIFPTQLLIRASTVENQPR
jgi:LacI family transcriptional regulator